ncbi:MAG: FeoB-associated Cys-rich membrane protein [Saccharofermentanales bacterium]|jgi:hypothetical protein
MNFYDIIIVAVLAFLVSFAAYRIFRPGKASGCGSSGCSGCGVSDCAGRAERSAVDGKKKR